MAQRERDASPALGGTFDHLHLQEQRSAEAQIHVLGSQEEEISG